MRTTLRKFGCPTLDFALLDDCTPHVPLCPTTFFSHQSIFANKLLYQGLNNIIESVQCKGRPKRWCMAAVRPSLRIEYFPRFRKSPVAPEEALRKESCNFQG